MNSPPNSRIARAGCVQSRLSCTASNRSQSIDFFHISQKRRYAVIPHSPFTRASIDLSAQKNRRALRLDGFFVQWRGQDLNLRPRGYEPRELPGCSTPRHVRTGL